MFLSPITSRPFHLLPAAALLLTLGACMREGVEPKRTLPEATQSGLNTAGAHVDGQVWLPATVLFAGTATKATYQRVNGHRELTVYLRRVTDGKADPFQQTSIELFVPDLKAPGTVVIDQTIPLHTVGGEYPYATFSYSLPSPGREFITSAAMRGQLTVTRLDTVARIVAGTFAFQAQERGTATTANVTEGRFDLRY